MRFKKFIATAKIDEDPGEKERRKELTRYARRSLASLAPANNPSSALGHIENRLQALLSKGVAARLANKDEDSNEVRRLTERLQEAITYYRVSGHTIIVLSTVDVEGQISQQQAIYDQITDLTVRISNLFQPVATMIDTVMIDPFIKSSFDVLLKLHEVAQHHKFITVSADG